MDSLVPLFPFLFFFSPALTDQKQPQRETTSYSPLTMPRPFHLDPILKASFGYSLSLRGTHLTA